MMPILSPKPKKYIVNMISEQTIKKPLVFTNSAGMHVPNDNEHPYVEHEHLTARHTWLSSVNLQPYPKDHNLMPSLKC